LSEKTNLSFSRNINIFTI